MRQKYVDLIKNFITSKPEYKATLDDIRNDTLSVGGTQEEFEEAVREIERGEIGPKKRFKNGKALRVGIAIALALVLIPSFVFVYNSQNSKKITKATNSTVVQDKTIADKVKDETVRVVYANSEPIDTSKVFSVNPNKVVLAYPGKPKKEVLGFFPYWMMENWDKVNLGALTSVALFGLEVNGNGEIVTRRDDGVVDPGWDMWNNPNLPLLIRKAKNNNLKVYLTVKSFSNDNIENLSKSDEAQQRMIATVSYLVSSRNLDGVNIDFEPTRGMDQTTRDGFTRLIKNLNVELKKQNPNAHLSVDTYLSSGSEQGLFDLPKLAQDIDAVVIMGYDMHTPKGDPGPLAAMGGSANVIGYVSNYLEKIPANKIILAVPYYGYDWPTEKSDGDGKGVPYAQIAEAVKTSNFTWDENSQTPYYSYVEDGKPRIVHYDNIRSLGIKYDYVLDKNLQGVGIWALGYDGNNVDLQKLLIDKFITN